MPVTAVVRSTEDALRADADACGRWVIAADEPDALGGTDSAPTPYELLAASLATCIAITLRMYARRKDWTLDAFEVEVCLDREDRPQRCAVDVRLPAGLPEHQRHRLAHVARRCPVHRTLQEGLVFDHTASVAS